jgi:hypothetical protein
LLSNYYRTLIPNDEEDFVLDEPMDNMKLFMAATEHRRLNLKMDGVELLYDLAPMADTPPTPQSVYKAELQRMLDKIDPMFFQVESMSVKACHGLKITIRNCPDIHRLNTIMNGEKVKENAAAAIRKIVRILATIYPQVRDELIDLAKPGYLWKLLVEGKNLEVCLRHFATTNKPSTVSNYCLFVRQFVQRYYAQYRVDCFAAFGLDPTEDVQSRDLIRDQVHSKMERVCSYIQKIGNDAKKKNRHSKIRRQQINVKESAGRIPNLDNYRTVLDCALKFFVNAYRRLKHVLDSNEPLYDQEKKCLCLALTDVMWATRVHFMYYCDAQRRNQYEDIRVQEFYVYLVELIIDKDERPTHKDRGHICLDLMDPLQNTKLIELTNKAIWSKGQYFIQIRRYPLRCDKRQRQKECSWSRWVLGGNQMVAKVIWYCTTILPLIRKTLRRHGKKFDTGAMFHHTQTFQPLYSASFLFHDKVSYYDYHADKKDFQIIKNDQGSAGATYWRHAFATIEMLKFENQEDYQWCMNMDEAAYEISIQMNTSRQEVKDTYSSLHIRDESASMPLVKPTTTLVLPDSDEEEDETPPNVSANRPVLCHTSSLCKP